MIRPWMGFSEDVFREIAKEINDYYRFTFVSPELGEGGSDDHEMEAYLTGSPDQKISIHTCVSVDHDPYFKVFRCDSSDDRWQIGATRISYFEPKYIGEVEDDIYLTSEEVDELIKALNGKYRDSDCTVWEAMISYHNETVTEEFKSNWKAGRMKTIPEDLSIPDYTLLKEENCK